MNNTFNGQVVDSMLLTIEYIIASQPYSKLTVFILEN